MANSSEDAASETYAIEAFKAPLLKRWGSTALALIIAVVTLGGNGSPVVGSGYRIVDRRTGEVLQEVSDSVAFGEAGSVLADDLAALTAAEFAHRWL